MLILLDNNVPRGLTRALRAHTVVEARERSWDALKNGELLDAAEGAGFHVLVTADNNIRYQHNLEGRNIAVVVLTQLRWTLVRRRLVEIAAAVDAAEVGSYLEVEIPFE
ncbi:MAG: hypothetical protein JNN08_18015 [Bryobacterales bacterium]|nr:hypothetical protein [Bryobacterales bacterium]